ncbi:hypothetical protein ACEK07_15385 [Alcanivoracaceae bacterium MT1]
MEALADTIGPWGGHGYKPVNPLLKPASKNGGGLQAVTGMITVFPQQIYGLNEGE